MYYPTKESGETYLYSESTGPVGETPEELIDDLQRFANALVKPVMLVKPGNKLEETDEVCATEVFSIQNG